MANTIEVVIRAVDNASKIIASIESNVTGSTSKIVKDLDGISKAAQSVDQRIANFGKGMSKFGNILSVGVTLPLAGVGAAAVKMAMDMEQTTIAFTSMLGSADAAKKHLEALRDFVAKTPFEFTELTQASKRMMAFGFEAEKVVPMLRDIGDATSALGLGSEGIDRVTRALGQMQAKGKVSGEEMMQITEAGIPGWRYLADAMGVTTAQVMKMSEQGLIPASKAIDALLAGMRKDFGGMMAAQSKTAAGQLSNLKDSIVSVGTSLGEVMLPTVKSAIGLVSALADTLKSMSPEMQQIVVTTGLLAASLGPIMKIGGTLIGNFKALKDVMIGVGSGALTMLRSMADVAGTLQRVGVTSYTVRDALIRLRASGALLSIELGIIGAGLIAIAKYLEEVGNAAQASTDDLIAMSRSGDWFKQAGASTEILANGQKRLKEALDATSVKIKAGAKNYADYKASLDATAKAAGYEIDAQGNLVQVVTSTTGRVEKLVQANYALSDSEYTAYKASTTQAYGIDLLNNSMLRTTQVQTDATSSGDALVDSMAQQAQQAMVTAETNKVIADNLQMQADAYNANIQRLADLRAAIGETISANAGLAESLAKSTREQVKQQLATTAIEGLKKAYDNRTLSATEYEKAVMAVQLRYGLATPASIAMSKAQSELTDKFISGKLRLDDYINASGRLPQAAADGIISTKELITLGLQPLEGEFINAKKTVDDFVASLASIPGNTTRMITPTLPRNPDRPGGYQRGGEFVVPPNPRGGNGDYYMAAFAPGERVNVTPAGAARGGAVSIGAVNITIGGTNATTANIEQAVYDGIAKVFNEARA